MEKTVQDDERCRIGSTVARLGVTAMEIRKAPFAGLDIIDEG